ncbi:MAG: alpha/beta fold hydrolase [Planctomycetaceae bacterium]|nr:alpha/beta fold hydrolase [Planctomycetaceae bacterium]
MFVARSPSDRVQSAALPRHFVAGLLCALFVATSVGCTATQYVTARNTANASLFGFIPTTQAEEPLTPRTMQVLRSCDLADKFDDPRALLISLQQAITTDPTADKIYAISEVSFRAGRKIEKQEPRAAVDFYGASVAYAYRYLFDEQFAYLRNPYDPQFRGACDLYNQALEAALKIVAKGNALRPGQTLKIESAEHTFNVTVELRGSRWHAEDFDRFEFVNDYEVKGLANQYQTFGLGVPLIAIQRKHEQPVSYERYYPPGLSFPVTAFLRLMPDAENGDPHKHRAVLELHDPLASTDVTVGPRVVPLQSDLSTPLAYFLQNASTTTEGRTVTLDQISTFGLLRPDKAAAIRGLYMLQPYEPDKIPVVFVHGLWSSPLTWTEMYNDLRGNPAIRNRFQFWFYFYPTGQPFWTSATQFRSDLIAMRSQLDPQRQQPALDQMVLVGHSMGGLVSRMQTIYSRDDFWHIVSDKPIESLQAKPEVKQQLRDLFYFEPSPSVKRVVTLGTPHRGSLFASSSLTYLSQKLITLPEMMFKEEVVRDNPGFFKSTECLEHKTSVDSLRRESPIFPVMLAAPKAPWVKYHNVVGLVPNQGVYGTLTNKVQKDSDGIVGFDSAHMTDVVSEIVVPADHMHVHSHPRSVLEVRRILLEHLNEVQSQLPSTIDGQKPLYTAVR